jgi:hypothetical protein
MGDAPYPGGCSGGTGKDEQRTNSGSRIRLTQASVRRRPSIVTNPKSVTAPYLEQDAESRPFRSPDN